MIPNCMGSIPIDCAIGRRIGVAIKMIGAISMIHPSTRRIRSIKSAITIGLFVNPTSMFAAMLGT